jgi:two-component system NtrC family response regulator
LAALRNRFQEDAMHALQPSLPPSIVGQTLVMRQLRHRLDRLAQADHPVLISGETGSGKELAAKAIHDASLLRGSFVDVNCATLRPELAAAELFGSRAGGFTGAVNREGLCMQARNGTLFLDEIGELPLDAQAMLLRVLALKVVRPIGGRQAQVVNFRLVCATHRDLGDMVRQGRFREDLLHRINTLSVRIPPLRERIDDIDALCRTFMESPFERLTPSARAALRAHLWPGNVRELRNVLASAETLADGPITAAHLDLKLTTRRPVAAPTMLVPLKVQMGRAVAHAVRAYEGNVRKAAQALQISPTTAYRYLGFAAAPDP